MAPAFARTAADGSLHGSVVADIEFQRFKRQVLFSSQCVELGAFFRRTSSGENAIAALREQERRGSAQTVRCAGDEHGFLKPCAVRHSSLQAKEALCYPGSYR